MTIFARRGHWRTSKFGVEHWVSETDVLRDDWSRYSMGDAHASALPESQDGISREAYRPERTAWAFVDPNARCPVCNEFVYFYQNDHGSRVFFDDLAPDWPKHPCMDGNDGRSRPESDVIRWSDSPEPRSADGMRQALKIVGLDQCAHWTPYRLLRRFGTRQGVALILQLLSPEQEGIHFFMCHRLPRAVRAGALVMRTRMKLAYLDLETMQPAEVRASRIRTAKSFVDELI